MMRTTDEDHGSTVLSPAKLGSKQIHRSSGCVENTCNSTESSTWHLLGQCQLGSDRFHQICAFVGDHIVQAKAPQQQWGICKGLGHLMLCIASTLLISLSMLSTCQMGHSKYRVQILYITLPTSTQTTSSTNIAGSTDTKLATSLISFDFGAQAPQSLSKAQSQLGRKL